MKRRHRTPSELQKVQRQFTSWRRTRNKRSPIPEPLWDGAVGLALEQGVNPVAQALRLDYYRLRDRVAAAEQAQRPEGRHSDFVELEVDPSAWGVPCTIELEDRAGAKMTIGLSRGSSTELVALVEAFWRRSS